MDDKRSCKDCKVVVVTGCSSGFGRAMVEAFLRDGWTVVGTVRATRRESGLDVLALAFSGRLDLRTLDFTRPTDAAELVEHVEKTYGRLDALVNNAGYGLFGALEDVTEAQLRRQLEVNFFGPALLSRSFLPLLRASKGRIINVSSVWGRISFPLTSAYCASKFALEGLTESLHHELRPHGVQVALVEPGAFPTSFTRNAEWPAQGASSAYGLETENWREERGRREDSAKGPDVALVAQATARLASSRRMPLRVALGKEATLMTIMKLMPQRLAGWVMGKVFAKIFLRARPRLPGAVRAA